MFKRADGIVDFDKSICIGCKACMAACPYDAIFINPDDHSAEKCNFCAHRIDMQLEPACVVVCPTQAILVGDMNDPDSYVAQIINRDTVAVRRPEKETLPKLFYKGAHQATLDPLAAKRPEGGLFMWSEQQEGAGYVTSGNPNFNNSFDSVGLACQSLYMDQRHRVRCLPDRVPARVTRRAERKQPDLVVGHAGYLRRFSGNHWWVAALGSRASRTIFHDLHETAVA
jgi:ferredoxin